MKKSIEISSVTLFPMPVKTKSITVPARERIGLENLQVLQTFRPVGGTAIPKKDALFDGHIFAFDPGVQRWLAAGEVPEFPSEALPYF